MPDWDQWDAEALETYVPWFTNENFVTHLLTPHNEHRVVLTKLQNLGLLLLNGQWDARLQAVTNAILHSVLAAAFWLLAHRLLFGPIPTTASVSSVPAPSSGAATFRQRVVLSGLIFLLTFALFGLPVAWQNVLGGFHSQQYWLVSLSFAAIVLLPFTRSWSPAWWVGAVSAALVLGSMGSGFIAASTVGVVVVWRLLRRETSAVATWPALTVAVALTALGVITRHEVPYHADMKAKTVHDFVFTIVHSLEWPWRHQHWAALVLWFPWLMLAWHVARLPRPSAPSVVAHRGPQAILALGGWVIVQLVATAYARGAGADYPASRYMDTLTFGVMANALALAFLLTRVRRSTALVIASCVWLGTLGVGIYTLLADTVRWELIGAKEYYVKAEGHMRRYLATNDPKNLAYPDIPFPSVDGLVERLAIPSLRAVMAPPLRTPLAIKPATADRATDAASLPFLENNAIGADIVRPPRIGLSATTPPLDYTKTWGSFEPSISSTHRSWESAPIEPTPFRWLRFETAGDIGGAKELRFELRDATTGRLLEEVRPSRIPGNAWRSAYVHMPERSFVIAAADRASAAWLAFSPPVEMGWLSYYAWQATKHAAFVFYVTAGLTVALLLLAGFSTRRAQQTSGT